MNWDSFVPDLIVGVVTGLVVGAAVLVLERRVAARARRVTSGAEQRAVVEQARRVLRHEVVFEQGPDYLLADRSQLNKIVDAVHAVSPGRADVPVPGYAWVAGMVRSLDEIDVLADGIRTRVRDRRGVFTQVVDETLQRTILSIVNAGPPVPDSWEWRWPQPLAAFATQSIEGDVFLTKLIQDYVRHRWFVDAYRRAFLNTDSWWRTKEEEARKEHLRGGPHGRIETWKRNKKYDEAMASATVWADIQSMHILSAVGRIDD